MAKQQEEFITSPPSWWELNKQEVMWNIVNSVLAGLLVFLGAFTNGNITFASIMISIATALIVAVTKFKDYWTTQEVEMSNHISKNKKGSLQLFNFINP